MTQYHMLQAMSCIILEMCGMLPQHLVLLADLHIVTVMCRCYRLLYYKATGPRASLHVSSNKASGRTGAHIEMLLPIQGRSS